MRKKIWVSGGYATTFFGSGRREFSPKAPMRPFEQYLQETAEGTLGAVPSPEIDEGILGSFMPGRFLKQANLPGFLPFMVPGLSGKPCTGVEGACGTGGRAIAMAARSVLSELSDTVFAAGFEMQNTMKAVYGADVLAGAAYYSKERKRGYAHFFPAIFAERAGAYYEKYGEEETRKGMAKWYEQMIHNARKNPKAQEYHNRADHLFERAMAPPDPERFIPYLNPLNCSKVSDGAASLLVLSDEGREKCGLSLEQCVEVAGLGEAEGDITRHPEDLTVLSTTKHAVQKALDSAGIGLEEIAVLEIHDCFTITALLALEAIGYAKPGEGAGFVMEGKTAKEGEIPTNLSGGLGGFGHPTGATGVRQMVDLWEQLTGRSANQAKLKSPYGMMISMGGDDKTVTCVVVRRGGEG